jgi:VWFA-related protein
MGRLCFCVLLAAALGTHAQEPRDAQPVFRTGVDLLPLLVAVLDRSGNPVGDLRADEFAVTLDGKPRSVSFARFYGSGRDASTALLAPTQPLAPKPQLAFSNAARHPGRVVVFMVDRDSMRAGSGKAVLETATTLLDRLAGSDASGFVALPAGRLAIGRDHQRVRKALENAVGTQRPPQEWRYHIDLREALSFERNDIVGIRHVLQRECGFAQARDCTEVIGEQAREMLFLIRSETRATLQALRQVIGGLREIRAPKLIVLLSAGIWFEQESLAEFNLLTRQAAETRTVVHAVQVDQVGFDVEDRGRGGSPFAASERLDGLRQVAASTGGAFFHAIGRAEGVFARIATEVTSFYEVGVDVLPEDVGTKVRTLRVTSTRPGVTVRSRRDMSFIPEAVAADVEGRLRHLLRQPVDVPELPIAIETYVTRGEARDTLKVIVAAEMDPRAAEGVDWAFVVFRDDQEAAYGRDRGHGTHRVVTAAQIPPGIFRVRLAAVAAGREGLVEAPLPVGLRAHGDLQSSDVIAGAFTAGRFIPRSTFSAGEEIQALLELYAADAAAFTSATVRFELYGEPGARPLMVAAAEPRATDAPGRRVCEVTLRAPEKSGRYVLSAVVEYNGRPVGKVSRVLTAR